MDYKKNFDSDLDSSIWVSASAGTGKTKILTDRVLKLLLAGKNPSKILCLTFTKAAAAEMSLRINKELSNWMISDYDSLKFKLGDLTDKNISIDFINHARGIFLKVLDAKDNLKIQTFHSFCQYIIKKFPFESNVIPGFNIADEQIVKLLIKESKDNLFKKINYSNYERIKNSVNYIACNIGESAFDDLIFEIINKKEYIINIINNYNDIDKALESLENLLNLDRKLSINEFYIGKTDMLVHALNILDQSKSISDQNQKNNILKWISLSDSEKINNTNIYNSIFLTKDKKALKNIITKQIAKNNCEIYDILIAEQDSLLDFVNNEKSKKIYDKSANLLVFSDAIIKEYTELKKKKLYIDYNDLTSTIFKLLNNPNINDWILYKLDGGIEHILIDEAQDTSENQWHIIKMITDEFFTTSENINKTIFVVGDEKQSIYSFQGADPEAFDLMHNYFKDKSIEQSKSFKSIDLDISFRSTKPILDLINHVFKNKNMLSSHNDEFDHKLHRINDAGSVELWPLIHIDSKEDDSWTILREYKYKINPLQKLAEFIAEKIKNWISSKRLIKSKARPINCGDILILVRKRGEFTDYLVREFRKRSLAIAGIDRMRITDHIAIKDLIAFGKFIISKEDDLNLACLLKSPLIGMSDEEIFTIAYNRKSTLWENLSANVNNKSIYKYAYDYLNDFLEKSDSYTPLELYIQILEIYDGRRKFYSRMGEEVNDPLDEYIDLCFRYQSENIPALQNFIEWIQSIDSEVKRDLDQIQNQIRIMTIHGAKGLQAPIVFLPDTNFSLNNSDKLLFFDDMLYWMGNSIDDNRFSSDIKINNKKQERYESNRLLYVALTRPQDELIICGYKNRNSNSENSWYNIIKNSMEKIAIKEDFIIDDNFREYFLNNKYYKITSNQIENVIGDNNENECDSELIEFPSFLLEAVKPQIDDLIEITPSNIENKNNRYPIDNHSLNKGKIIHKILQYIINIDEEERSIMIENFVENNAIKYHLNDIQKKEIIDNCRNLINSDEIRNLFRKKLRTEVSVNGVVLNKYKVSGQIDLIAIDDDNINIIDYKTDIVLPKNSSEISKSYLKQIALYRYLIKKIYKDKNITCSIIWTNKPKLMNINNELIEQTINELNQ